MNAMKTLGQGLLVTICVLGLAGAVSAAPKAISSCKIIDEPGSYIVTKNLMGSGHCLRVHASHVTIDLGGYVLSGDGTGTGVVADDSRTGVSVRNGTVTGFGDGINLAGPGGIVEQIRAHGNTFDGVVVGPGYVVKASVASENGGDGIKAANGGSQITGNVTMGNGFQGISVWCPASLVANSAIDNAGGNLVTVGGGCVLSQNAAP